MEQLTQAITVMAQQTNQLMQQQQQLLQIMIKQTESSKNEHQLPPFPEFNKDKEAWKDYTLRLNQHFQAYKVTDEQQKRAFLLTWVGQEIFQLLTKLCQDKCPTEYNFSELMKMLDQYFEERVHVLAARFNFFQCRMKENQTHDEWATELRGSSQKMQVYV